MDKRTYVYVLLNPLEVGEWSYNDFIFSHKPFYVGIGTSQRAKYHSLDSTLERGVNKNKINTIKDIKNKGCEVIITKIASGLSRESAVKLEEDLIKHFGKLSNKTGILTNIGIRHRESSVNALGSKNIRSKNVYQYDLEGNFIREFGCLRAIPHESKINIDYNTIGDACRGNKLKNGTDYSAGGYMWFYDFRGDKIKHQVINNTHCKPVFEYCFKTLKLKNTYKSAVEAAKVNNTTKNVVSSCCLKLLKNNYLIFSYSELTTEELLKIRNNYNYYICIIDGYSHIVFTLMEISILTGIELKTLNYWNTYNKLPDFIKKIKRRT